MNRNFSIAAIITAASILLSGCGACSTKTNNEQPKTNSNAQTDPKMNNSVEIKKGVYTEHLPKTFTMPTDPVGKKLLKEYGAVFMAQSGAVVPKVVIFPDAASVTAFQASAPSTSDTVSGMAIELQTPAMNALKEAVAEAEQSGIKITPHAEDAAKRSYEDTVTLWASRVEPGLDHWVKEKKISKSDAERIRKMSPFDQVPEIFKLESQGMYFSKDLQKSIIFSVAPPGSSQHLSMLALDVTEHANAKVRAILAKHGWYQTVATDLPHFTFLGMPESELPKYGIKKTKSGDREFWVPAV